jgi:hypothetical protein
MHLHLVVDSIVSVLRSQTSTEPSNEPEDHVVAQAEIRTKVESVEAVIAYIDAARDVIWEVPPAEVLALGTGTVPRGTGAKNNYLSTLIFAENELRTLTDEILWFAWATATRNPDADLKTLVLYMDEMGQYKANMNDYVGLPEGGEILKMYVGGILLAKNLDEFARLTESAMTYFNRLHGWVDIVFPWGLVNGFQRVNPLQKIIDAASA